MSNLTRILAGLTVAISLAAQGSSSRASSSV